MFKNLKRVVAFVLSIAVVMQVCMWDGITKTYATNRNPDEAINWVKSICGQSLDKDGAYGAQCVDLILAYYDYLGVPRSSGNGKDYATNSLPSGWSRVQGGTPQKGDILVYGASNDNPYGHVAIYESDNSTYHQNFNNKQSVVKVTYKYNGLSNPYWGYIRPNWGSGTNTQPTDNSGWTSSASEISETDAKLSARLTLPSKTRFWWAGCNIFDANGNLLVQLGEDTTGNNNYIDIWYNITEESKNHYKLSPGTTYKYHFYVNYNGSDHFSPMYSFTTKGPVTTQKPATTQKATTTQAATTTQSVPASVITKAERRGEVIYLSWTQPSGVSGYNIIYSKNSDMTGAKGLFWSNAEIKMTHEYGEGVVECDGYIAMTEPDSPYYITIQAYKDVGGTKTYSAKSSPIMVEPFDESKVIIDTTVDVTTEATTEEKIAPTPTTEKTAATTEDSYYYDDDEHSYDDSTFIPSIDTITFVSKKKGQATFKWYPEPSYVDGYQISYSSKWAFNSSEDFKYAKHINIKSRYVGSKKINGLKKGKRYYIHIRGYKIVNGVKQYGDWDVVWSCKIKKK